MTGILNISEASALALHALIYLEAHNNRKVSTREIADAFSVSGAHLAKVMRRLVKTGMVRSLRGPKGGYTMNKNGSEIKLFQLYEMFEGPLPEKICLFNNPVCKLKQCVMDVSLKRINELALDYMRKTTLSEIVELYLKGRENYNEEKDNKNK